MLLAILILWGFQIISQVYASISSCTNYDSNMGASFDLSDLQRLPGQPSYVVEDGDIPCTKQIEQTYLYVFNICGVVTDTGLLPYSCNSLKSRSAALQIDQRQTKNNTADDYCYSVGQYDQNSATLSLLDQNDPSAGLVLTYTGDACQTKNRKFMIQMICADKLNPIPTHALEYTHCEYTVTIPSVYGCPTQCQVSNRHLCDGHGYCGYDNDIKSARCFCNTGYTGSDCSQTVSTSTVINYSPALLGLIITLFIIVALLGIGVGFLGWQYTAYKQDIANYKVLSSTTHEFGDSATV